MRSLILASLLTSLTHLTSSIPTNPQQSDSQWEPNTTLSLPISHEALRLSIRTTSLTLDPSAYASALSNALEMLKEAIKEGKEGDYDRRDQKWTIWMSSFAPYTLVSVYPLPWVGFFGPRLAVEVLESVKGVKGAPLKCEFEVTGESELEVVAAGFVGDGIPIPGDERDGLVGEGDVVMI